MKVLLQNTRTGNYFESGSAWTAGIVEACDFKEISAALTFAMRKNIPHVQMVLKFEGEDYDVSEREPDERVLSE